MVEKASYTGPWQVPWKRAKKDPSAPKRPMSAFLYFSQGKRSVLKQQNPNMKNTEVSRLLGEMWRNASEEEKRPHVEKEKAEREKYKVAIAEWRKDFEAKQEKKRQLEAEQMAAINKYQYTMSEAAQAAGAVPPPPPGMPPPGMMPYGDPFGAAGGAPPGGPPTMSTYMFQGHPMSYRKFRSFSCLSGMCFPTLVVLRKS